MSEKKYVGMFVIINLAGVFTAVLRRRSKYKWEHNCLQPQSFAGVLEPTWYGKMAPEDDNDFFAALIREGVEEVGKKATNFALTSSFPASEVYAGNGRAGAEVRLYAIKMPESFLGLHRSDISGAGIELAKQNEIRNILPATMCHKPGIPCDKMRMDTSEIAGLKRAFEIFSTSQ